MTVRNKIERARRVVLYGSMIVAAVAAFALIRVTGERLPASSHAVEWSRAGDTSAVNTTAESLLALVVIIVVAHLCGIVFTLAAQPAVIGEIVGGIILGPSVLGYLAPTVQASLLPEHVLPFLNVHAHVGVIVYLFLIGLELNLDIVRRSSRATIAISHASILVPFVLGSAIALGIYPIVSTTGVGFTAFALFLGTSMSVTAFPVLARILTDLKLAKSPMGTIAITCAAIDDISAWCLLALAVSITRANPLDAVRTIVLTLAYLIAMLGPIASVARRLTFVIDEAPKVSRGWLTVVSVAMLASAIATESIGIHVFVGAFLFGLIVPARSHLATELNARLYDVVSVLFLPAFFAYSGLRTQIDLLNDVRDWLLCIAIVAVASLGKFGGSLAASRLSGISWRDSAALGVLMNARGLVELIVLNIGLDLGIISAKLFTMLVLMAVVTTLAATPLLAVLLRRHPWAEHAHDNGEASNASSKSE